MPIRARGVVGTVVVATVAAVVATFQFAGAAVVSEPARVVAVTPFRILDTREGIGRAGVTSPVAGGQTIDVSVAGLGSVPADATGVIVNITGTGATAATYVTVWPTGEPRPNASTLNLTPGVDSPNGATVLLGGGMISLYVNSGSTHLVADVTGYLTTAASVPAPTVPAPVTTAASVPTPTVPAPVSKSLVFPGLSLGWTPSPDLAASDYGLLFNDFVGSGTTTSNQATLFIPKPSDWNGTSVVTVSATFLNPGYTATGFTRFLLRPYSFNGPPDSYANAAQLTAPPQQMTQSYGTYTFTWQVPASTLTKTNWSFRLARANNGGDATYGGDAYNSAIVLTSATVTYTSS